MPKWVFQHTKGAFTHEDKEKLAKGMSNIYTTFGLPAFFAHVQFISFDPDEFWTGGEPAHDSVTISIYHAAANIRTGFEGESLMKALDDVVRPVLKPKGLTWESNVYETPREWWRLQGMAPPDFNSEMLKRWAKDNGFTDEDEEQLLREQGYFDESRWKLPTFDGVK
ncbi:hypothetical protein CDV31_012970 [Fusarium ambrosium]|uniref:Tautomerase cis-CaaD-like domain-containing protein n=1 Tax=Fusarium ambrosium TaxID=131363 RepID=A0A428T6E1_9HYPO|nr:hypothetical protein CDV31_012970 [Fusarium ambrosium]